MWSQCSNVTSNTCIMYFILSPRFFLIKKKWKRKWWLCDPLMIISNYAKLLKPLQWLCKRSKIINKLCRFWMNSKRTSLKYSNKFEKVFKIIRNYARCIKPRGQSIWVFMTMNVISSQISTFFYILFSGKTISFAATPPLVCFSCRLAPRPVHSEPFLNSDNKPW